MIRAVLNATWRVALNSQGNRVVKRLVLLGPGSAPGTLQHLLRVPQACNDCH